MIQLRPFQRDFIRAVQSDKYDICAMSLARGNGKSFLSTQLLLPYLKLESPVFNPHKELGLVAASIKQSRIVFRFLRESLGEEDYKYSDAANRLGIKHRDSNVRLEVYSSDPKRAVGIVGTSLVVSDEPGSWETNAGSLMFEALTTAQGKPGSPLKLVFVGTIGPCPVRLVALWPRRLLLGTLLITPVFFFGVSNRSVPARDPARKIGERRPRDSLRLSPLLPYFWSLSEKSRVPPRHTWPQVTVYVDAFFTHEDEEGRRWRRTDLTGVHVTSSERDDFDIKGLPGEDISEEKSVQVLEVLSPSFQRDNKWYFAQGEAKYYATIEDEDFLARVEGREERFGKDDALRVEMVVDVTRDEAGKLRFDRRITRVLEHLRATEGDQHELI